jgi:hypothetical protein
MVAFGSATAAAQATDDSSGGGPYLAVRQEDGSYDLSPLGEGGVGTNEEKSRCPEPECWSHCCEECPCNCCECDKWC